MPKNEIYERETDRPLYGWFNTRQQRAGKTIYNAWLGLGQVAAVSYQPDDRDSCCDADPASCVRCTPGWRVSLIDRDALNAAMAAARCDDATAELMDLLIDGQIAGLFRTAREAKVRGEKALGVTGHRPAAPKLKPAPGKPWNMDSYLILPPAEDGSELFGGVFDLYDDYHAKDPDDLWGADKHDVCWYAGIFTVTFDSDLVEDYEYERIGWAADHHHLTESDARAALEAQFYSDESERADGSS